MLFEVLFFIRKFYISFVHIMNGGPNLSTGVFGHNLWIKCYVVTTFDLGSLFTNPGHPPHLPKYGNHILIQLIESSLKKKIILPRESGEKETQVHKWTGVLRRVVQHLYRSSGNGLCRETGVWRVEGLDIQFI